jgi:ABC-2 type transport system ATP-binding protein
MLKKISIIASLMNDQPLYILDEPTSSLDPKTITALKDLLVDFRTKGRTIILSTHILDIAERLSDRIIIINKGKLVCNEPIERLQALEPDDNRTKLEKLYFEMTA